MRGHTRAAWLLVVGLSLAGISGAEATRDERACRQGAEHMIEFGRQALADPNSRPERIAKRRKLVEGWDQRLRRGENPCAVYADIQRAAATF